MLIIAKILFKSSLFKSIKYKLTVEVYLFKMIKHEFTRLHHLLNLFKMIKYEPTLRIDPPDFSLKV